MNRDNIPLPATESPSLASAQPRKPWKIWIGALICTLILNILCFPFWMGYDMMGFIHTPFHEKAPLVIGYRGLITGDNPFSITSTPDFGSPNYFYASDVQLCTIHLNTEWKWKQYNITLKIRRKGELRIKLMGADADESNDYGEAYSTCTDYNKLKINQKVIFAKSKTLSYGETFIHRIPVSANDVIRIAFEARRHHLNADDFNLVKKKIWYIVTLSVLTFLVSATMLQRLAASYKRGKAGDAIFLFVFFILLTIPLSNLSDAKKAVREGRSLAQRPKVTSVFKDGANFGKMYDDWFSDHLGGRNLLIKIHDTVQRDTQRIIRGSHAWYMQESGWLFMTPFAGSLSTDHVHTIVTTLVQLGKFCDAAHIKFYVLAVPRKENIYQEKLYGYGLDKKKIDTENAIHREIQRLTAKRHLPYIYPRTELRDACEQDYTFFKLTHHWTEWGAYVGYRALMKEISKDFPDIPVVSVENCKRTRSILIRDSYMRSFHYGHLMKYCNFWTDDRHPRPLYNYYEHKNAGRLMIKAGRFIKDYTYGGGACKALVIGTSMNDNLMQFLPFSFARTRYIRINRNFDLSTSEQWKIMKYYKKDILSYKPDILILSIVGDRWQLYKMLPNTFKP